MTFDEWWDSLSTREQHIADRELTKAAWQVSAMLMQERCAKACLNNSVDGYGYLPLVADAIRALGD